MDTRIANPRGLGFGAWAIGGWMYSMVPAAWFPVEQMASPTLQSVATFVKIALLIAALASFLRGDSWHGLFFMFWSAVWWSFDGNPSGSQAFLGWYYLAVAVFSLIIWLGAMRAGLALPVRLLSLGVWVAFALWALGYLFALNVLFLIGGYVGLLGSAAAFWAAAGDILGSSLSAEAGPGVAPTA